MLATEDDKSVFRFFDLPPELRDIIYHAALITIDRTLPNSGATYKATSVASTNLLLLSQQFRAEYRAVMQKHVAVQFFTSCDDCYCDADIKLPHFLYSAERVTVILDVRLYLGVFIWEVEEDLDHCAKWLPDFLCNVLEAARPTLIIRYLGYDSDILPGVLYPILAFCKRLSRKGMQTFLYSASADSWDTKMTKPGPSLEEYGIPILKLSTETAEFEVLPSAADSLSEAELAGVKIWDRTHDSHDVTEAASYLE